MDTEKFVEVTIVMPREGGLKLEVDGNWTVLDLKTKIQKLSQIPSKDQILIGEDKEAPILNDDCAMLETVHPWATSSVMNVTLLTKLVEPEMLQLPIYIFHRSRDGIAEATYEPIEVKVESSASVKQLKMKINEMTGIAPQRQQFIARLQHLPPVPIMKMQDTHILEDILCVGLNEEYKLILFKARRRLLTPIKVLVPSIGIEETLMMDVECDTVFTLMAKVRKHVVHRFLTDEETFRMYTGVNSEIPLVIGSAILARYQINSAHFNQVYVELDIGAARLQQYAAASISDED